MSATTVYTQIYEMLDPYLDAKVDVTTRHRLTLLVEGILHGKSAAPAAIARVVRELGLTRAEPASVERQIRRSENDPELTAAQCVHPLARERLLLGRPRELLLIVDPTTQEDRLVLVTIGVWYQGRTLPLVWAVWAANTPLKGAGFWERIKTLLDTVAKLLPANVPVTWLADRAFGTPAFTDLLETHGWHYIVRVQGQTRCRDRQGREQSCRALVPRRQDRAKLVGQVFKKQGWRTAAVLAYFGRHATAPLCLVTDLGAHWYLIAVYRQRYGIEGTFRDYKSHGWQWEQGQVTDPDHVEHLLVAMALALWIALATGTQVAQAWLAQPPSGHRHTLPWGGKRSLFTLGLHRLEGGLYGSTDLHLEWRLTGWEAPTWERQLLTHYVAAFVATDHHDCRCFSKCKGTTTAATSPVRP